MAGRTEPEMANPSSHLSRGAGSGAGENLTDRNRGPPIRNAFVCRAQTAAQTARSPETYAADIHCRRAEMLLRRAQGKGGIRLCVTLHKRSGSEHGVRGDERWLLKAGWSLSRHGARVPCMLFRGRQDSSAESTSGGHKARQAWALLPEAKRVKAPQMEWSEERQEIAVRPGCCSTLW